MDTHRTMFYERGEGFTYYLRILRVTYTRSHSQESEALLLNYKTFIPVQLTRDAAFTTPKFESISETVARANAWLSITGKQFANFCAFEVRSPQVLRIIYRHRQLCH